MLVGGSINNWAGIKACLLLSLRRRHQLGGHCHFGWGLGVSCWVVHTGGVGVSWCCSDPIQLEALLCYALEHPPRPTPSPTLPNPHVQGMLQLPDPTIHTLAESLAGPEPGASAVARAVTGVSERPS